MDYAGHSFGRYVTAPRDLQDVVAHVDELERFIRSRKQTASYVANTLAQGRSFNNVRNPAANWPFFPNAPVDLDDRNVILTCIERLLTPDALFGVRPVIWEELNIVEEPRTLASSVFHLARRCKAAATALLELRLGDAFCLMQLAYEDVQDVDTPELIGSLLSAFGRLRVGYIMHMVAVDGAAQLHVPTGFKALDRLDLLGNAQALHEGTGKGVLTKEIKRCRSVLELFRRSVTFGGVGGYVDQITAVSRREEQKLRAALKAIGSLDLLDRAEREERRWRTQHGAQFEPILAQVIDKLIRRLDRLATDVAAHTEPANAVVGNRDRLGAAHKLYLAAEQAAAWIEDGRGHYEQFDDDGERYFARNKVRRPIPTLGIDSMVEWLQNGRRDKCPMPQSANDPANIGRLFTLYRLAFLRDDEALPTKLRMFKHPQTGELQRIKTINALEKLLGCPIDFHQMWDAYNEDVEARVKPGMTSAQQRNAMNIDYTVKREVNEYRKNLKLYISNQHRKTKKPLTANQVKEFVAAASVVDDLMLRAF